MGVIRYTHTYNVNVMLKPFTKHLCLCFLYLQVIKNQSISAKPPKCDFCVFQLKMFVCLLSFWTCREFDLQQSASSRFILTPTRVGGEKSRVMTVSVSASNNARAVMMLIRKHN